MAKQMEHKIINADSRELKTIETKSVQLRV